MKKPKNLQARTTKSPQLSSSAKPQKSPIKGRKKKTISWYKKEADKWFSKYVRYRDGERRADGWYSLCISSQKWYPMAQMQAGHFVSRRVSSLRYDEENVNAQSVGDNMFKQGNQYEYAIQLDLKYGEGTAKKLHDRRFETHSFTREELEQIISDAKTQIEYYENQE